MEIDYEATAKSAFDVPLDDEARDALRVWGDLLEAQGDPRGPLIALEHAAFADRRERDRLVLAHAKALLGRFAPLCDEPRTVELDIRAGALYSATLDLRRQDADALTGVIDRLFEAPFAHPMRRLVVRLRFASEVTRIARVLAQAPAGVALEQIALIVGPRATNVGFITRDVTGILEARFPHLWLFAGVAAIVPLVPGMDCANANPATPAGRRAIGRCLFDIRMQAVALARIAELGPRALAFVDALVALLSPNVIRDPLVHVACCAAVAALGPRHGAAAVPTLRKLTGRTEHYSVEARRAAGQALAQLV